MTNSSNIWLPSLQTTNLQEGYDLVINLARMAVKFTQPSDPIGQQLRDVYARDADALIASTQGAIMVHLATIAAANNYWNDHA